MLADLEAVLARELAGYTVRSVTPLGAASRYRRARRHTCQRPRLVSYTCSRRKLARRRPPQRCGCRSLRWHPARTGSRWLPPSPIWPMPLDAPGRRADPRARPRDEAEAELVDAISRWERAKSAADARQIGPSRRWLGGRCSPAAPSMAPRTPATHPHRRLDRVRRAAHFPGHARSRVELACELVEHLPDTLAALAAGRIDMYRAGVLVEETRPLAAHQRRAPGRGRPAGQRGSPNRDPATGRCPSRSLGCRPYDSRRAVHPGPRRTRNPATRSGTGRDGLLPDPHGRRGPRGILGRHRLRRPAREGATPTTLEPLTSSAPTPSPSCAGPRWRWTSRLLQPNMRPSANRSARRSRGASVEITVPISTLLGLDQQPGHLHGYGPITADVARRIATKGTWRRLLTDPVTGTLLDYGTTRYTRRPTWSITSTPVIAPAASRRALIQPRPATSTTPRRWAKADPPARVTAVRCIAGTTSTRRITVGGSNSPNQADSSGPRRPVTPTKSIPRSSDPLSQPTSRPSRSRRLRPTPTHRRSDAGRIEQVCDVGMTRNTRVDWMRSGG